MIRTLSLLAFLLPAAAQAQMPVPCGTDADVRAALTEQHNEIPLLYGLSVDGSLMRIWTSPDNRTWTVTMTDPKSGYTCLRAMGRNLDTAPTATPAPAPVEPPA